MGGVGGHSLLALYPGLMQQCTTVTAHSELLPAHLLARSLVYQHAMVPKSTVYGRGNYQVLRATVPIGLNLAPVLFDCTSALISICTPALGHQSTNNQSPWLPLTFQQTGAVINKLYSCTQLASIVGLLFIDWGVTRDFQTCRRYADPIPANQSRGGVGALPSHRYSPRPILGLLDHGCA